jgi:DNA-binding MarR family transcriptional regulator
MHLVAIDTAGALRTAETLNSVASILLRRPSSGLSLTASGTLSLLVRVGPLRITDLAARMHVSQPSMTELVSRLERAGLVVRARDQTDGRVVQVELTPAGWELRERVRSERAEHLAVLLARLDGEDRRALEAAVPALDRLLEVAAEVLDEDEKEMEREARA